jgi:hypothetical protein
VIDGDLEWIRGVPKPAYRHVHRHEAYCIENLVVCEMALALIISQDMSVSEDEAELKLDFGTWMKMHVGPLSDLFAAYATAQQFAPALKTVSNGVGALCTAGGKGKPPTLEPTKVLGAQVSALQASEARAGPAATRAFFDATRRRVLALPRPIDAISGKDFILPLLMFHLRGIGCGVSRRALKMRLAAACGEGQFAKLRKDLLKTAKGGV